MPESKEFDIASECRQQAEWLRSERLMKSWDSVRRQIANGSNHSGPRDAFESWIDEPAIALEKAALEI